MARDSPEKEIEEVRRRPDLEKTSRSGGFVARLDVGVEGKYSWDARTRDDASGFATISPEAAIGWRSGSRLRIVGGEVQPAAQDGRNPGELDSAAGEEEP